MSSYRLKACPKCNGDLMIDGGDWLCLQCGTYQYSFYIVPLGEREKSPWKRTAKGVVVTGKFVSR